MPTFAVLGDPISHSLSPVIHQTGFDAAGLEGYTYVRHQCPAGQLAALITALGEDYHGFSVTMPGKFEALAFAQTVTQRARLIGSANTLYRDHTGWVADNTDGMGVVGALDALGELATERPAVIVGSGGTARPALWAVAQRGFRTVRIVCRRQEKAEEIRDLAAAVGITDLKWYPFDQAAQACAGVGVVISTVPSVAVEGQESDFCQAPIVDVIYDPPMTALRRTAEALGQPHVGGLTMLYFQGLEQFRLFTGQQPDAAAIAHALSQAAGQDIAGAR